MRARFALAVALFGLIAWAGQGMAATPEELAKIQTDLIAKKQQDNALKSQLDKTEEELAALRENLVKATHEQARSEGILHDLSDKLSQLEANEAEQKKNLAAQQGQITSLVLALLKLSRTPPELLLMTPGKPIDALRSGLLMRRALPYYAQEAQRISGQMQELDDTRDAILKKREALLEAQKNFTEQQQQLNGLLAERQAWLKATQGQRADLDKQIAMLSAEAQNIQDLINKVVSPSMKMPERLRKIKSVSFVPPTKGSVVYGFGDPDDVGSHSRGMMLKVHGGEMVVAPADGQVVFAGPFKGYGTILILRHGGDYHSFMAGFGRLDVVAGQEVNAGEPLGRIPLETPSGQLYFELRYHGSPVNPAQHIHVAGG